MILTAEVKMPDSLVEQGARIFGPPPPKEAPKIDAVDLRSQDLHPAAPICGPNVDRRRARGRPDVAVDPIRDQRRDVAPRIRFGKPADQEASEQPARRIDRCRKAATRSRWPIAA